ncbi:MAG: hypothetical protein KF841_03995 [Phycisphaerae bacterium]|nr:hypothetical protein [Phycisphaerae bacterium]
MNRVAIWMIALCVIVSASSTRAAGPSDLLKQAVEENEHQDKASAKPMAEADRMAAEADRLLDAREFERAVRLYEGAYRLDPNNRAMYARLLVAKRAAGVMTEQDREALALIEEEQANEVNQTFRRVRLLIIQARQAVRSGDLELAVDRTDNARTSLDGLPRHIDTSPYRRELSQITESIARKAAKAAKADRAGESSAVVARRSNSTRVLTLSEIGEESSETDFETAPRSSIRSNSLSEFAESGEIVAIDEALYGEFAIHAYERELARSLARQRARHLIDNQVAAFPPPPGADIAYPADWAERAARRAAQRDGVIHEGQTYTGTDGQSYQTVIYDLAELVHPVPNFYASYPGTVREQRMQTLDRQYLRERSMIFNGWPEDLAAGMPLLHYFGGVDNNAISTRTDPYETARIMSILERFVNNPGAPSVTAPADSR